MKFTFLLIMLLALKGFTQPKNEINLPNGGKDIEINNLTSLYSLYITKNQEVFNDDKKLEYFQDVNYTFLNQLNKNISMGIPLVLIYADIKTPFKFVSKIKQYIPNHRWLFYMTENIEGLKATAFRNYGSAKNFGLEEILTMEEENDLLVEGFPFAPPLPPPSMWYNDFEDIIYSGKKEDINEVLKKHTHNTLKVSLNKTLTHKGKIIDSNNLKKILEETDVVFLKFDNDILYEDYIHVVQEINRILKQIEKLKESGAYVIEISFQLEELYMDLGIELN
ncbi:hypothetical protein CJ739_2886 [Mariniflexile rhizosphaerae]|uniref:hypothetical protein n=1 Tax=unclassified Mariniflexile TaxID=2643887 RepID=UPI000CB5CED1|nr:hypothetical protein [Mariniflexile sp. TRM1-10]AXP81951.1 hypothetical protein CJ739_2886 [Mariniflexile sp. TRM1-10]PLB18026.1 MAG: hypothetical protein TRG1_3114 [Flavobacteriaceae bacterium FS1-H7996/R]